MNKYTFTPGVRRGVSFWIPVTVFLAVVALIIALLPTTSAARADEVDFETENSTLSEFADQIEALTDSFVVEEAETPSEILEEDSGLIDEEAPEVSDNEASGEDVEADDLLETLDAFVGPMQIAPMQATDLDAEGFRPVEVTVNGIKHSNPGKDAAGNPIVVGDGIEIWGTWDARKLTSNLQVDDRFTIDIPNPPLGIVPIPIKELMGPDGTSWGQCEDNEARNRYECTVTFIAEDPISGQPHTEIHGTWEGSGNANAVSPQYNIEAAPDGTLGKDGRLIVSGELLAGEPSATVTRWTGTIDGPANTFITEDMVLTDTFDSKLRICASDTITNLQVGRLGESYPAEANADGNVMTITVDVPSEGIELGTGSPLQIIYSLCTASGGMDPKGTEYFNNLSWNGLSDSARVEQDRQTSGTAIGVTRGSFSLTKALDPVPAGFDPLTVPFSVNVQEFAPGQYPDGDFETEYTLQVTAGGAAVTGLNSRPTGWTIKLSEVQLPAAPEGYDWGTPQFSGDGFETGVEAVVPITQAGNVAVSLTNFLHSNTPEIGTKAVVDGTTDNVLSLAGGQVTDTVAYKNLKPNTDYTISGEIVAVDENNDYVSTGITSVGEFTTGDAPAGELYVDGDATVIFTITPEQAAAWADQKLVVFETLYEVGVTASIVEHHNPSDLEQTFWVVEGEPAIGTTAAVDGNEDNLLPLTGGTVVDTVDYVFLQPNTEYRLDGVLMHVVGSAATSTGITGTATFTTGDAAPGQFYVSGTAEVTFTISADNAQEYGGQKLVVYETLFDAATGDEVVNHHNPDDVKQTFYVDAPEVTLGTSAATNGPNSKLLPLTGGEVVDTVSYTNLQPNTEYRLEGELRHVVGTTGIETGITSEATFTTPDAPAGEYFVSGTALVVFTISADEAAQYGGQTLVVYESLFDGDQPTPVAVHHDPTSESQSFEVERPEVEIKTKATVTDNPVENIMELTGGEVVDTVSYTNLEPNTEYRLDGELMHVDAAGTPTATGIFGSTNFITPAAAAGEFYVSGTVDVIFTISAEDAAEYAGEKLVVFEVLFDVETEAEIADHQDPNDEDQSFIIRERTPEIGTKAEVQGGDPKLLPITGGQVVDTVTYTDLRPNTDYRLEGQLMHVAENGTVTETGITADGQFTTPAAAAGEFYVSGTSAITFTISAEDAAEYAGEKLVVFEVLFDVETGDEVADHQDPNDEDQSFDIEPGNSIIVTKTVTGPKGDEVENDEDAVFQVRAQWTDIQGNEQSRVFNVTPGEPAVLAGLPVDTEITLTEVGADTSVRNVKWGDIIWSGEGVNDQSGDSADGTVILANANDPVRVGLENKTSSNSLIIIPIPVPLIPGGGSSEPPAPTEPVAPSEPTAPEEPADVAPAAPSQPGDQVAAKQPQPKGLAVTGADVMWIAGGGLSVLLLGAWLVLRGRRNES